MKEIRQFSGFKKPKRENDGRIVIGALLLWVLFFPITLFAVGEILIENVQAKRLEHDRWEATALVMNVTEEPREVVLRGQITFYDQTAPKGDLPVSILRKDLTLILKPDEVRPVKIHFIDEGGAPKGSLRLEPFFRIRRQRVWSY